MNLFIIGNGFDLAHELPTSYKHFHSYLKTMYPKALETSPSFNISSTLMPDGSEVYDDDEVVAFLMDVISKAEEDGDHWCNIEQSLGYLDFDDYLDDMSYLYDEDDENFNEWHMAYNHEDVSQNFYHVTIQIKEFFSRWINSIDISDVEVKPTLNDLIDASNDYVINFNYTRVLEDIYGVENVFHIHGEQNNEIIIGHGVEREDFENGYVGTEFSLAELHSSLRKDTSKIIRANRSLFDSLGLVNKIYSHGFSFSEVDLPYIKEICSVLDTKDITWYLNDYDSIETRSRFIESIKECGFKGDFAVFNI
ncbi:bacteriophage abortive infection AbiH family protein [Lysinibacillus sp. NPDC093197]|uniref:bacteriophage abortive infection AbiH family protein n=1 Tax=Lysinibacillus sp. NPDC093197 TaxID=3364132 RepID=UPI00380E69E1